MTVVQRSALVALPASTLYTLVNNVADYQRWFDWCVDSQVLSLDPGSMHARLALRVGPVPISFTTINRLQPFERIELALQDGPLDRLQGAWTFKALGDNGCRVELALDFEIAGGWFDSAFRRGFEHIANRMVDDFVRVAKEQAVG